ncbi:hypothetical protein AB0D67_24350 [Streptosporangium sp. NPDC048047]|uniref:hypothetical protein n=1 Tax=Streptosporangium sp. NPDC048047 TaxID=3155748 RepID=UPI003430B15F
MHVAIPLYPRFTALDAVGPYTVLAFAPGFTVTFVAASPGPVPDDRGGSGLTATASLADFGAEPVSDRVVVDGRVVTAAGVSAGIDMALALLARVSDAETARAVQLAIEYAPEPPFDAGSANGAPADLRERALGLIA